MFKYKISKSHAFAAICFALALSQSAIAQRDKLGQVTYTPPPGYTKTSNVANVVAFSTFDQATGRFCIITLYGASPGSGNPSADFAREWKTNVVDNLGATANPATETQVEDGWTITAGGAAVEVQGTKALAMLTVMSGFGKTVAVLGVFNDQTFLSAFAAFASSLDIDRTVASAPPASTAPAQPFRTENGRLIIPMPTRQLTVADLAGEWGETAGFSQTYVDRYSGTYAGTDSLHFRNTRKIAANGAYTNDFFAIQNGKKIIDKTAGMVSINGRVLSIKERNTARYVIRGWLELPDYTVLKICGPWYDGDTIPEAIFSNPDQGANLNQEWVRKK
ncbi:MAG: hypothetical protein AB7V18_12090 [Pyrinomonadaceae bacterium]